MSRVPEMSASIRVERVVLETMLTQARWDPSIECCGLLAGRDGVITTLAPVYNALTSATAYEIAPNQLFEFFRRIRAEKLEHLGIYHSHPATDNAPSPTDIERAYYPDAAYFIISPRPDAPKPIRAFRIAEGRATEIEIEEV